MTFKISLDQASYSNSQVLRDIKIEIYPGEIVGLIGPNGCGKSTLIRSAVGIHVEWDGYVQIGSVKIEKPEPGNLRDLGVVYLPQSNVVFEHLSLIDNIRAAQLPIESLSQISAIKLLPETLAHRKLEIASKLSGGERQLLGLWMILANNPNVLLLDEPCASLATAAAQQLLQLLKIKVKENGISVIIAEQRILELLKVVDKVAVIEDRIIGFLGTVNDFFKTDYASKLSLI